MKNMNANEMRAINGGAYKCLTKVTKKIGGYYYSTTCGHIGYTKVTMGYHFLFAHDGKNCVYTVI